MQLKSGSKINGMKPEILIALIIADGVWSRNGKELVVTEVTGSKHGRGSLHYVGLAADLRTNYFTEDEKEQVARELRMFLNEEYDVVVEDTHIHIEYQPK